MSQPWRILRVLLGAGLLAFAARAQTLTTLHSFTGGADGASPGAALLLSGNTLYGTAFLGGAGNGNVFALHTDGSGFTNLHSFLGYNYNDGANPAAGLVLVGNTFYGTTEMGGSPGHVGTLFKVNTNGTGYANARSFTAVSFPNSLNSDGANPVAGMVLSGNVLYGTAAGGGTSGAGTVFAFDSASAGFTNLHNFPATLGPLLTNTDGANPYAGVVVSGHLLYGTARKGGVWGKGAVFVLDSELTRDTNNAVETSFYGFTNLHSFGATSGPSATNSDGATPYAGLVLGGSNLYGTTREGGIWGFGTVFKLNTDGTGFTNLHQFTALVPNGNAPYNSDGAFPEGGVVLFGDTLYGTARNGGALGRGTLFSLKTDGTGFTTLYNFAGDFSEGGSPDAGLVLSGYTLYGTTELGGAWGNGTVFKLSVLPRLSIATSGMNVLLSWPTNFAGFDYTGFHLEATTNAVAPIWVTNFPEPVVVNGQTTVTNPLSGSEQFFRLSQ